MKKQLERCGKRPQDRSSPFQILEFGEILFFILFKTRFLPLLKTVLDPVPMLFLTRSKPIFALSKPLFPLSKPVPSLSCTAHLSYLDTCHLQPNHWTTSDHHQFVDQWEVCIHGEEMLGTSLHDMSTPSCWRKQSDAIRKVRAQGALHVKKKRRLNAPDKKRGRGGGGETQLQPPIAVGRLQG